MTNPATRQRLLVSVLMSLVGAGLLIWHLASPAGNQLDGWSVALLVLVFLPWLGPIFESITFPGGGVKYQQIEAKQERQEEEIKALQFLVANFLTGDEVKYLKVLADPGPLDFGGDQKNAIRLFECVRQLHRLGFVRSKTNLNPDALVNSGGTDLKQLFEITELGNEYLKLRNDTPSS